MKKLILYFVGIDATSQRKIRNRNFSSYKCGARSPLVKATVCKSSSVIMNFKRFGLQLKRRVSPAQKMVVSVDNGWMVLYEECAEKKKTGSMYDSLRFVFCSLISGSIP